MFCISSRATACLIGLALASPVRQAAAAASISVTDLDGDAVANGDTTPDPADSTDFGSVVAAGEVFFDRTFQIENTGDDTLDLTGSPRVTVTGEVAQFEDLDHLDAGRTDSAGASTTFTVRFHPTGARGRANATVSIPHSLPGSPYTFAITGLATNSSPTIDQGESALVTMSEDGAPTPFTLQLSRTDPDFDFGTWSISSVSAAGTASVTSNGKVSFAPIANLTGDTSFTVNFADGFGGSDAIVVNVTIQPVDDLPVFVVKGPFVVDASEPAGSIVGNFDAHNGDGGSMDQGLLYSVVGGSAQGIFSVDALTGVLRVADAAALVAAAGTAPILQVRVGDAHSTRDADAQVFVRVEVFFANGFE